MYAASYNKLFNYNELNESQMVLERIKDMIGEYINNIITVLYMIFIAPAIFIESPGPIFFTKVMIGKNGMLFKIYKF